MMVQRVQEPFPRFSKNGGRTLSIRGLSGLALFCAGLALLGCGNQPKIAGPPAERTVGVIHPERGPMSLSIELPGDLVGFYEAALHAKVTGYLASISVDKGDRVKAGQVLAVIEVPELHSNLEQAQAMMAIDEITYQRLRRVQISDARLIAQQDIDIANAKYRQAQASVHTLQTMVGYTRIIAPFDGVITGRFADPGTLIRAGGGDIGVSESSAQISPGATEGAGGHRGGGGPLLTLAKIDKLRVYVYVSGRWCPYIRRGTPAVLTFDDLPGVSVTGSVTRYAAALDLSTRTMLTEIDIENPTGVLYPRMYAHVKLVLVTHPDAIRLPIAAVNQEGSKASVFIVRNGQLAETQVQTGITSPDYIEITSGLTMNDLVVASFSTDLRKGTKVHATMESQPGRPALTDTVAR
jgi:membrane fusion protein (multidrug efflux system)